MVAFSDTDLSETEKVAMYVAGVLCELSKLGLVVGGSFSVTGKGELTLRHLMDTGYRPPDEEIRNCLRFLFQTNNVDAPFALVTGFIDGRIKPSA